MFVSEPITQNINYNIPGVKVRGGQHRVAVSQAK